MDRTTPNKTVAGGGLGGAFGVIAVIMAPKISDITWSAEEAALTTAALGTLFAWAVRYLPGPRARQ